MLKKMGIVILLVETLINNIMECCHLELVQFELVGILKALDILSKNTSCPLTTKYCRVSILLVFASLTSERFPSLSS